MRSLAVLLPLSLASVLLAPGAAHAQAPAAPSPTAEAPPPVPASPPAPASGPELLPLFSLRLAPGGAGYASPTGAFHFDMDLTAGFRLGMLIDDVWVAPLLEAGYTVHEGSVVHGRGDYFIAGAGASVGTLEVAGALVPAYLVGVSEGDTVHGMRMAARVDFFLGVWSLEVAHEWRSVRGADVHSIRFTATIDLGIILSWALNFVGGARRPADTTPPS